MMKLTVNAYNAADHAARDRACNRLIEAVTPATFLLRGYPVVAKDDNDVQRYYDTMHELGEDSAYEDGLGGFTHDEFELFKSVSEKAIKWTEKQYGKPMVPKGSLVRAMIAYRAIRMISDPKRDAIFELGSGAGFLAVRLAEAGYRIAASEIAHGYYMAQSHLWEGLFGDRLIELANDPRDLMSMDQIPEGAIVHVPWWKFNLLNAEKAKLSVDLFTANHMLCEMHATAFKYTVHFSKQMLAGSDGAGIFLSEGPGADDLRSRNQMVTEFQVAEFSRAITTGPIDVFTVNSPLIDETILKEKYVPIYVRCGRLSESVLNDPNEALSDENLNVSVRGARIDLEAGIEGDGGARSSVMKLPLRIIKVISSKGLNGLLDHARSYLFGTKLKTDEESTKALPGAMSRRNVKSANLSSWATSTLPSVLTRHERLISTCFEVGYEDIQGAPRVSFEEMRSFQHSIVGDADLYSEDERFLRFAYGQSDW